MKTRNPLIEYFRKTIKTGYFPLKETATDWVGLIEVGYDWETEERISVTPEQLEEAKKVLIRMARQS